MSEITSAYPEIHVSDISRFQECQRRFFYSNTKWGLGYQSPRDHPSAILGSWFHYARYLMLKDGLNCQLAHAETMRKQSEIWSTNPYIHPADYADLAIQFNHLLQAYVLWQKDDHSLYSDEGLEFLMLEDTVHFEYEGFLLSFTCDGVARVKATGEVIVFERKTTKYPDQLELGVQFDLQPRFYAWAVQHLWGYKIRGVVYEFIKNTDPLTVPLLQSGLPTQDKNKLLGTTLEVYLAALEHQIEAIGADYSATMEKYAKSLELLKNNPSPIFRRVYLPMPDCLKEAGIRTMLSVAGEMAQARALGSDVPPALNRHTCFGFRDGGCAYKDVCLAHDYGDDYKLMLEAEFIKDKGRF